MDRRGKLKFINSSLSCSSQVWVIELVLQSLYHYRARQRPHLNILCHRLIRQAANKLNHYLMFLVQMLPPPPQLYLPCWLINMGPRESKMHCWILQTMLKWLEGVGTALALAHRWCSFSRLVILSIHCSTSLEFHLQHSNRKWNMRFPLLCPNDMHRAIFSIGNDHFLARKRITKL